MNKKIVLGLSGIAFTIILYLVPVAVFIYVPVASFSSRPYAYFDPLSFLGEDPLTTLGERLNILYGITFALLGASVTVLSVGMYQNYKHRKSKSNNK